MKKNLGKIFILWLVLHVEVFATTYIWSASANKTLAYKNEPIYLKYVCEFSDRAEFFTIDFNPSGEYGDFTLKSLSQNSTIVDGKKVNSYEFVAYPKVAKEIKFDFTATIKETTKESVENIIIGRDNNKKQDFKKSSYKPKLLRVEVKETFSDLSGDLNIKVQKAEPTTKAYEPYHLRLKIEGSANFLALKPIDLNISGVKIFATKVMQNTKLTQSGESGEWSQSFAFVGDKDFVIPEIKIEYFNLKNQKLESLMVEKTAIKVTKGFDKKELLDKPKDEKSWFDFSYIYYALTFLTGFLVAKIEFKRPKKIKTDSFALKIEEAKTLHELMIILLFIDAKKYETLILDIESKKITSLKEAKRRVL